MWTAESRNDCWAQMEEPEDGACWAFIKGRVQLFVYGFYPEASRWRVNIAFILLVLAIVPVLYDKCPGRTYGLWYAVSFQFMKAEISKEMETMMIVLLIYLVFSLLISAFMNWFNRRITLAER